MRNISKRNVYALHKKVSLLGPKYVLWERDMDHGFQTYHGEEPTNKSFYKNVSLDYNRMSRKWSIKTKDKTKYTTSEIFTLGFNNTTHYFQDSESNLFYFFRDGVVKGPLKIYCYVTKLIKLINENTQLLIQKPIDYTKWTMTHWN